MPNNPDISSIFDVYSMREQMPADADKKLTTEFRNRVRLFCGDMVQPYEYYSMSGAQVGWYWAELRDKLRYRHGQTELAGRNQFTAVTEVEKFVSECADEHFLDFIELFFHSNALLAYFSEDYLKEAVGTINEFLTIDALPYRLTGFTIDRSRKNDVKVWVNSPINYRAEGISQRAKSYPTEVKVSKVIAYPQIIRSDSEALHETAIQPTLTLLANPAFKSADEEFRDALKDYREGEYADCVAKCGSSFESVMKVICESRGWSYQQTDSAQKLLNAIFEETGMESFFKDPVMLVATIRNRLSSAHGAGARQRDVTKHIAQYAVNATASAILLLVGETNL